jgi:hypothetical protein
VTGYVLSPEAKEDIRDIRFEGQYDQGNIARERRQRSELA